MATQSHRRFLRRECSRRYHNLNSALRFVAALAVALLPCSLCGDESQNGISVGQPKVFDNRSLQSMVEQFEQSLLATQFVNKTDLAGAIGTFQGSRVSDTSRSLEITSLPTPQIVTEAAAASGSLSPTKQTTTESSISPKPPLADTSSGTVPDAVAKKYGIAATDLLDEQVNLTYQIFNLRMLLERSLTDRDFRGKPRLQSVLGFQISLDPPRKYKGCAAVVEIRVLPVGSSDPVSLVAMMPQEKTYNVASLTTRVNQFGASAIVKVVQVGYSERHRGQTFFLVKDTDTYAFERDEKPEKGKPKELVFGWIFRPVLDRTAVDAGTRQVFAVIAPPVDDSIGSGPKAENVSIAVRTYWVPFDRKTATTKNAPRHGSLHEGNPEPLGLFTSSELHSDLSATLSKVQWSESGGDGALVSVTGDHFYSGTSAFVGGKVLNNASNGLVLKDDHYLQIVTPLSSLTYQDGKISGRYGAPADLVDPRVKEWKNSALWGLGQPEVGWTANPDRLTSTLTVRLFAKDGVSLPELYEYQPILTVGVQAFPPSRSHAGFTNCSSDPKKLDKCFRMEVDVPTEVLSSEVPLDISVPFLGSDYHIHEFAYTPFRTVTAVRLREGDDGIVLGISGTQFKDGVRVYADKTYELGKSKELTSISRDLIELRVGKKDLDSVKQLVVQAPSGKALVIPVPTGKPEPQKPTITGTAETTVNSSSGVNFAGKNLGAIKKVTFEGEALQFQSGKSGESITVYLTRKVTSKAGTVEVLGATEDGTLIPAKIVILDTKPRSATKSVNKPGTPPSDKN
jgi:hypothetical protein